MIAILLKEMYFIKRKKCCFGFPYHNRLSCIRCGEDPLIWMIYKLSTLHIFDLLGEMGSAFHFYVK